MDGHGRLLSVVVSAGQAGDNPHLPAVIDAIRVPTGGRPRSRPDTLIADKAYSPPSTRLLLRARRIRTVIPQRSDQIAYRQTKGAAGGRPPDFDRDTYRLRNVVERPSTGSNSGAASPPATTRRPATTALRSCSPQ